MISQYFFTTTIKQLECKELKKNKWNEWVIASHYDWFAHIYTLKCNQTRAFTVLVLVRALVLSFVRAMHQFMHAFRTMWIINCNRWNWYHLHDGSNSIPFLTLLFHFTWSCVLSVNETTILIFNWNGNFSQFWFIT